MTLFYDQKCFNGPSKDFLGGLEVPTKCPALSWKFWMSQLDSSMIGQHEDSAKMWGSQLLSFVFYCEDARCEKKLRATAVRLLGALFHLSFKRWSNQGICQADDICSRRIPCPRDSGCRHKTQKSPNCKNHTPPKTKIFPWKSIVGRWNVLLKWSLFRWHLNFLGYLYGGFPLTSSPKPTASWKDLTWL